MLNSKNFWNKKVYDLMMEHIQMLRGYDKKYFKDNIRTGLMIRRKILLNQEFTNSEIQYIKGAKELQVA